MAQAPCWTWDPSRGEGGVKKKNPIILTLNSSVRSTGARAAGQENKKPWPKGKLATIRRKYE